MTLMRRETIPIGPPKGIEVRDFILKYRFLSIFWIRANFIENNNILYMGNGRGILGECLEYI